MNRFYTLVISIFITSSVFSQNIPLQNQTTIKNGTKKSENVIQLIPSIPLPKHTMVRGQGFGNNQCFSHELTKKYYESIGKWQDFNESYLEEIAKLKPSPTDKTPGVNNISVIFHVVYNPNNPAENVSNALIQQVFSDIQEDFQLLNVDAINARSQFGFVPYDANINFCLATKTQAGVPLTELGVIRVSTMEDYYNINSGEENKMKASASGGSQIWDRNKYLNVWICDISNGANSGTAGYAYRPTNAMLPGSSIDGIVLDYNLGMNNDNVLTHEIGHYLGLDHTWGGSGTCANDDGFNDTPNTAGPSFNYAGTCSGNQITCGAIQTQYENYMDYSNCTVMYTANQGAYMLSILTGIRNSLLLSPGCDPINAPPVADFSADISNPIIVPVGGAVNFFDQTTNLPTSWLWNFGGGAANSIVQNPNVIFNTIGTYTVTLTATNAYGSDAEVKTSFVQVVGTAPGIACDTLRNYIPVVEDYAYYNWSTGWGFFPGSGRYSSTPASLIYQYADKYTAPASTQVRRLRFPIAKAVNSSGSGLMKIRIQQDNAGNPGTVIVTDTLLISDMDAGYYNEFDFTNPPTVTGNFWVTFELFYGAPQDSIALMCVDFDYRNGTIALGANTMRCYYGGVSNTTGTWHPPTDINPIIKSSLWLDVLTSNGPAPDANATFTDSEVCLGGQITVNGSGSINTNSYLWYLTDDPFTTILSSSSASGTTFTFNQVGNRRIYLFADGSCKTDGIYLPIIVNALPTATVTTTHTSCGQNNGSIVFSNPASGNGPNYQYSIDGINYQNSPNFINLASGTYIVHISTPSDNCDRVYTRTINPSSELTATISQGVTICEGESTTLTATGGTTYAWYDGANLIGSLSSITVFPIASSQYTCLVTEGACQVTVSTNVIVDDCGVGLSEIPVHFKVYPNPTEGLLNIEIAGGYNYSLVDTRGRLVFKGNGQDTEQLDIYSLGSGVYILKIKSQSFERNIKVIKE